MDMQNKKVNIGIDQPLQSAHVPYGLMLVSASRRLVGVSYPDFSLKPEATVKCIKAGLKEFGGRGAFAWTDLSVEAADFGQKIIFPDNSTPHPDYNDPLIKDVGGYRKLKKVNLKNASRMQHILETIRILIEREGFKDSVGGFCFGPLGVLNMMRGSNHLFRDCIRYPADVMSALETITESLIEYVEAQCDAGVRAIMLDTLYASWSGLSRELWEKIEGPFVKELAVAIRGKGCTVGVHNCGHGPYFDSQIRFMEPTTISFAHLPDDCKDRKELKKRYGNQVTLGGYISTPLLSYGTPDEVIQECRMQIEDLAPGGGYVLSPGCEFPPNAPFENARAIIKAAAMY